MSERVRNQDVAAGALSEPSELLSRVAMAIMGMAVLICAGLALSFLTATPAAAQTASTPGFKQIFDTWKQLDQTARAPAAIPSTMPVAGTNFTSGFGVRADPFQRRAAMHAGIDLAGPYGTEIRATADGVVGRSKWVNGYGNLVELEHGSGIQTRYGHLSRSLVSPGQHVKRGDVIALMGSTGRSTGNHLHYEVRLDGKAVNPVAFMQSGDYLIALQRRAADPTRIAMGGPVGGAK
jgi:murein DD-endopeptidase MepM/ murein hydrolase activator NlpD